MGAVLFFRGKKKKTSRGAFRRGGVRFKGPWKKYTFSSYATERGTRRAWLSGEEGKKKKKKRHDPRRISQKKAESFSRGRTEKRDVSPLGLVLPEKGGDQPPDYCSLRRGRKKKRTDSAPIAGRRGKGSREEKKKKPRRKKKKPTTSEEEKKGKREAPRGLESRRGKKNGLTREKER